MTDPHKGLKAIYELDAAVCDEPWRRWQYDHPFASWFPCHERGPLWLPEFQYRRHPDAPPLADVVKEILGCTAKNVWRSLKDDGPSKAGLNWERVLVRNSDGLNISLTTARDVNCFSWAEYWCEIDQTPIGPPEPEPEIEWESKQELLVSLGNRQYESVEIVELDEAERRIREAKGVE